MNEDYIIISAVPFLQQYKLISGATSPISIGEVVRSKDGDYIENMVTVGDPLPHQVDQKFLVGKIMFWVKETIRIRLFCNLSADEIVEIDSDLNGDPELEIREFAEVIIALPSEKPDEMTVCVTFRFDEKGISVRARREDTGENLKVEINPK